MKPLAIVSAVIACAFANVVHANGVVCMEPAEMSAALIDWYQERPVGQPQKLPDSTLQV